MSEPPHRFDEFPDTGKARVIVAPENADKMETLVSFSPRLHGRTCANVSEMMAKVAMLCGCPKSVFLCYTKTYTFSASNVNRPT